MTDDTDGTQPTFDDGRRHDPRREPHPDWPVIESTTEYETGWVQAGYDLVEQPDGTQKRYYWAELATAVVVWCRGVPGCGSALAGSAGALRGVRYVTGSAARLSGETLQQAAPGLVLRPANRRRRRIRQE